MTFVNDSKRESDDVNKANLTSSGDETSRKRTKHSHESDVIASAIGKRSKREKLLR